MHSALIGGEVQRLLLETAYDMEMIDGSLVFVPYDTLLYSLPYRNVTYPALKSNGKLLRAYDAVLTITINSPQLSFYEAYQDAMDAREVAGTLKPQQVMHGCRAFAGEGLCTAAMPVIKAAPSRNLSVCSAGVSSLWNHLQLDPLHGSRRASCSTIKGVDVWGELGKKYS